MMIELTVETLAAVSIPVAGAFFALYGRAIAAENASLKEQISILKEQHDQDVRRIDSDHESDIKRIDRNHDDIWQEIKCQRESLNQNREAVVRLNASIDRLNEILTRLDSTVSNKVGKTDCELIRQQYIDKRRHPHSPMPGGSRVDDPKL